jgi:hypothetical protein
MSIQFGLKISCDRRIRSLTGGPDVTWGGFFDGGLDRVGGSSPLRKNDFIISEIISRQRRSL